MATIPVHLLEHTKLSKQNKEFLSQIGLPENFGFDLTEMPDFRRFDIGETATDQYGDELSGIACYILGRASRENSFLCLCVPMGHIIMVRRSLWERNSYRNSYDVFFVNSSARQLAESLSLFERYWSMIVDTCKGDFARADILSEELSSEMRRVDAEAMKENWWSYWWQRTDRILG